MTAAVVAPRLTLDDVFGRALVIHEGGGNYSDVPLPNSGGARLGCGVVVTATPVMPPGRPRGADGAAARYRGACPPAGGAGAKSGLTL